MISTSTENFNNNLLCKKLCELQTSLLEIIYDPVSLWIHFGYLAPRWSHYRFLRQNPHIQGDTPSSATSFRGYSSVIVITISFAKTWIDLPSRIFLFQLNHQSLAPIWKRFSVLQPNELREWISIILPRLWSLSSGCYCGSAGSRKEKFKRETGDGW